MKWGYVSYHFSHHYINYCILCNEKAEKKPKKSRAESWQHYSSPMEVLDQAPVYFTLAKYYGLQDMYLATPSNCEQRVQEELHSYASGVLSAQHTEVLGGT